MTSTNYVTTRNSVIGRGPGDRLYYRSNGGPNDNVFVSMNALCTTSDTVSDTPDLTSKLPGTFIFTKHLPRSSALLVAFCIVYELVPLVSQSTTSKVCDVAITDDVNNRDTALAPQYLSYIPV